MLDHNYFEPIIKEIRKSIKLHKQSLELFFTDCNCNTPEQIGECFACRTKKSIKKLEQIRSEMYSISKNTIYFPQYIDVESFLYSITHQHNDIKTEIEPIFQNPNAELDFSEKPIELLINLTTSRYAMDGNGYHVGYENVTFQFKAFRKTELGITGLPYLLSSFVVNPNEFDIVELDLPDEDKYEHDPDCEFADSDSFDDCDCLDFWEGYTHPDDDFHFQEMQNIIWNTNWIEATFDGETRVWKLGYVSFDVAEYQTNPDYADSCNEDDGLPSFHDYSS